MKPSRHITKAALGVTRWIGSVQSILVHTIIFAAGFGAVAARLLPFDRMLLVLNTIVSLEAIYLALFIQMTVNYTTESIEEVEQDIDEIQENIEDIQENVDVLQEDVSEMSDEELAEEGRKQEQKKTLGDIQTDLRRLLADVERLKNVQP